MTAGGRDLTVKVRSLPRQRYSLGLADSCLHMLKLRYYERKGVP
jgi:hypothetical protein